MDITDAQHLLRRTEFVARPSRVDELASMSRAEAVADVLDVARNGTPELPPRFQTHDPEGSWEQYVAACTWWLDRMVQSARPVQERMTLFWHGHFTSNWWEVGHGFHMMVQNHLYRRLCLGDFLELTQRMAIEPAMLVYLSNAYNVKGEPNQNFARELMELFTLGVGNYTEADVDAAARAWTGHNALWPEYDYVFRSTHHDSLPKTFFGTTKNWDGPDIIDELLRDNPGTRQVAARFITRKLWEFFAGTAPQTTLLDDLAGVFTDSELSLDALMSALLQRDEFYEPGVRQGLIRSPIEWFVALCHATGLTGDDLGVSWAAEATGQSFFRPPNVSGWRLNHAWLSTSALNGRAQIARGVTWRLRQHGGWDHLHSLTVDQAVDEVAAFFSIEPLSPTSRAAMVAAHRAERDAQPWASWWAPTNLLTMAMLTPEFHQA